MEEIKDHYKQRIFPPPFVMTARQRQMVDEVGKSLWTFNAVHDKMDYATVIIRFQEGEVKLAPIDYEEIQFGLNEVL